MMEQRLRSLTKAFSWRIIATIDLFLISYLFTGQVPKASSITLVFSLLQIFLYYLHERAWSGWKNPSIREFFPVLIVYLCLFGLLLLTIG
jgi:uncharacterized membrane protein